jgi:chromosome segregation ATPase
LKKRSKNVDKKDFVFCAILLALGVVFTGILGYIRDGHSGKLADARQLSIEYRSELDRAAERIASLEASNSRLNEHLRSASGNVERLESLTSQTISDTRAASRLVKEIAVQVQSLIGELDRWRSGSDSRDGLDNLDDL